MAIDKSNGYLVYAGGIQLEHPDCWIVLDSVTNYTTGDLLYFSKDDNFYVLPNAQSGHLEVWRFQNRSCSKKYDIEAELFHNNINNYHHIHNYLVESLSGNLLMVRMYVAEAKEDYNDGSCNNNSFKTDSFEVLKLDFESRQWKPMPRLGDDEAIFVGSNSSFTLSSSKYPEVISNCIYFRDHLCPHHGDNMLHGKGDNGIFHLDDCTFTPLFTGECTQAPVWICPPDHWWTQHIQDLRNMAYLESLC